MQEMKKEIRKTSWGFVALGALLLLVGTTMIFQGIEAHKAGVIIPPTTKSGPMTGLQSIMIGCFAAFLGTAFLGYEVFKKIKRK